jgi:hypothetical protein
VSPYSQPFFFGASFESELLLLLLALCAPSFVSMFPFSRLPLLGYPCRAGYQQIYQQVSHERFLERSFRSVDSYWQRLLMIQKKIREQCVVENAKRGICKQSVKGWSTSWKLQ